MRPLSPSAFETGAYRDPSPEEDIEIILRKKRRRRNHEGGEGPTSASIYTRVTNREYAVPTGRPRDRIWDLFEGQPRSPTVLCKLCTQTLQSSKVDRMRKHIDKECPNASRDTEAIKIFNQSCTRRNALATNRKKGVKKGDEGHLPDHEQEMGMELDPALQGRDGTDIAVGSSSGGMDKAENVILLPPPS